VQLSFFAYAQIPGRAPEDWNRVYGNSFLRDSIIGFLQFPLLGLGAMWLWRERYRLAIPLLVAGFILRSVLVAFFPA
jgi:hypothetical protein